MRTLKEAGNLKGKKVLLRVDFDVPVSDKGEIEESFRIKKQKETLDYLVAQGAQVLMIAHLHKKEDSFSALIPQLHILLGHEIGFIKTTESISEYLEKYSGPGLLENTKSFVGEEESSPEFAQVLAKDFDMYINNAFATCHRSYASMVGVPKLLPSYAGLMVEEEVRQLSKVIDAPKQGKIVIMGGAKASTKVPVIKNLIDKAEAVLVGGVVANDILKQKGQDMGSSVVDSDLHLLLMNLDLNDSRLYVPEDFVIFDNKILDIGDLTMRTYLDMVQGAKTIIWNGPMGLFENPMFAKGTNEIAQAVAQSNGITVIGGGDTISAVDKIHLLDKFSFVSTGGGAMLAFLAGDKLPGLVVLD